MDFKDLTPEQQAKARTCASPAEMLEFARAEGYDLTDEQLEGISGGWACEEDYTPFDPADWDE